VKGWVEPIALPSWPIRLGEDLGEGQMRLIFGMIIGAALMVGGAYVADAMAGTEAKPIVNWSVVAKNIETMTALARAGWKRIAG